MKVIYFSSNEELIRLMNQYSEDSDIIFKNMYSDFIPLNKCSEYFDTTRDFVSCH